MKLLQNQESFATIVSMALGGKKKKHHTPDRVIDVQNADQLIAEMRNLDHGK